MATAAQILANQTNAQSSTGPRTEEGKGRSRFNGILHGFTSKQLVLPHENPEEYAEFRTNLLKDLAPANTLEAALAERVVETWWRLQRFYRIENAFMANRMDAIGEAHPEMRGGDAALATLFTDPAEMARTRLMLRYLTTAERAYNKAFADLTKVQSERRKQEALAEKSRRRSAMKEAWIDGQHEKTSARPAAGFASQHTESSVGSTASATAGGASHRPAAPRSEI